VDSRLTGIVLAGGEGRRMGRDKALLVLGGRSLLERAVERVAEVCDEVIVASSRHEAEEWTGVRARFVPDETPGLGPLGGLQAGMRAASYDHVLLVACDMPFLSVPLLAAMRGTPRDYDALVPRTGDVWHPLHAIYSRRCLPVIDSLLRNGPASMRALIESVSVREVPFQVVSRFNRDRWSFVNVNDPGDLEIARAMWADLERPAGRRPAGIA
jgi:molybdenum cofactor guanylyltransferase